MTSPRVLVACVGNIFLGDDGFGVEVARRVAAHSLPQGVQVVDYGIRGFDLAYALMDGCEAAILVDAMPRGGAPGTLYVVEPDFDALDGAAVETHGMDPLTVLRLVKALGGRPGRLLVVGCEPAPAAADDDWQIGLSPAVQAAVDEAVSLVASLAATALADHRGAAPVEEGRGLAI